MVDLGLKIGLIEKSGAWFSYKGEKLGQGRENIRKLLKENTKLAAEIEAAIRAHGKDISQAMIMGAEDEPAAED